MQDIGISVFRDYNFEEHHLRFQNQSYPSRYLLLKRKQ
jgi:hypothetical protein